MMGTQNIKLSIFSASDNIKQIYSVSRNNKKNNEFLAQFI